MLDSLQSRPRERGAHRGAEHRRPARAGKGRRREAARRAGRADRRAPVPPLRRGAPQRAARPPGTRRLREGRRRASRVRGREPDGGERHVVYGAGRRRARARLPLADPPRAARGGARSASSTARTTRTSSPSGCTRSRPSRSGGRATRTSATSSGCSSTRGRRCSRCSSTSLATSSAPVPGADRRSGQALEVPARRPEGARALRRLDRRVGGGRHRDLDRRGRRGTSCRPTATG